MFSVPSEMKGVAETLFLPLYFRALETLKKDGLFKDPLAVELVSQINYDFSRLKHFDLLRSVVAMRVHQFDRCVQVFVNKNPSGTIVNLGCGLDTRFQRFDNGCLKWYEVDLPEVIAFRKCFFKPAKRYRYISGSILDPNRLKSIETASEDGVLFLAEGLFPYFRESVLRKIVVNLSCRFPGGMLIFDAVSPTQAVLSRFHPAFRIPGVHIRWGVDRADVIETWGAGLRLLWQDYYFSEAQHRMGWYNLFRFFPHVRYGFSMVALRFEPA